MLQSQLGRVDVVTDALERARPAVAGHCRRVAAYAVRLAVQYELDRDTIETIRLGALLHDVGKMLIAPRILDKPSRPTEREWQELRIHPQLGVDIAHRTGFDDEVCGIVLYHHERYDGRGYPDGLAGRQIPFPARLVSVMDAFDALTSARDYRDQLSVEAARQLIAREAGTKYCPWIVSGLLALPAAMLTPPAREEAAPEWAEVSGPFISDPGVLRQEWRGTEAGVN